MTSTSFVLLLSASGVAAFTAPSHLLSASGVAKRPLTVTSATSGSYPTVNGWTADPDAFAYGLPGALDPVGEFDPAGFLTNDDGSVKTLSETKSKCPAASAACRLPSSLLANNFMSIVQCCVRRR